MGGIRIFPYRNSIWLQPESLIKEIFLNQSLSDFLVRHFCFYGKFSSYIFLAFVVQVHSYFTESVIRVDGDAKLGVNYLEDG